MTRPVAVTGLSVEFARARRPAVHRVDLEVGAGERVVLTGPSGCGKSTLVRALTGVVPQSVRATVRGRLDVLGHDPRTTPVPRLALDVGWLGQDPSTNACLPLVEDEVALPLENRGVPPAAIPGRVRAALELVGAAHLMGRRVSRLSGGEQQRVALAAVLVGDPALLLLDEPTAMLDPVGAARVLDALRRDRPGRAVVLVEHRPDRLPWVPDRTVRLGTAGGAPGAPSTRPAAGQPGGGHRTRRGAHHGPARLVLCGATFLQDGREVVQDVDLTLRAGQVTAVLGANGAGKSSLLLGCAGFLPGDAPARAADVALAFQRPEHQLLARTVAREVGARGRPWLERVGLADLADADPFRLSGGQQRRLALAAVLALGRPVLLADEPTAGLDPVAADGVVRLLLDAADDGAAVALATHDLGLAARVADQVVVLAGGRCLAVGGPEVLDDDAVLRAAGLLAEVARRDARCADVPDAARPGAAARDEEVPG